MKTILFDLDGTLLNTEEGVTKCVQYALRHFGIDEPDLTKLLIFIGPPLEDQFMGIYGLTAEQAEEGVQKYRERYSVYGTSETKLYPKVEETLGFLQEKGFVLAVASSKNESACVRLMEHFGIAQYFDLICGATDDGRISAKADVLKLAMSRIGSGNPEDYVLVGDTRYDAAGAKAVGMDCLGVSYGFGTREELEALGVIGVCDSMEEVGRYLAGQL